MVTNHLIATFLWALTGFFLYLLSRFTGIMVPILCVVGPALVAVSAYRCLYEMVKLTRASESRK